MIRNGDGVLTATWLYGAQAYVNRTNVWYADGHATSVAERFTAAKLFSGTVTPNARSAGAGTGFLAADDSAYGGR